MASPSHAKRPERLQLGDEVRVIAPSWSLAMIDKNVQQIATDRFEANGLTLTFGEHVNELDRFMSSSIESRVADLHAAFADPNVQGIFAVIGGYNANQLLPYLDWDLIAANPKIFCGYSDTTALSCAMYERSDLITYSGPAYSTFGMRDHFELTERWCWSVLFDGGPIALEPSPTWSDDEWYLDQDARVLRESNGYWGIQEGSAGGPLVGGNLCTLNLLQGTPYMPDLAGHVLFLEDDHGSSVGLFDRDLTSLTQVPGFDEIAALLIGRFQQATKMTRRTLEAIIASKRELDGVPVIANLDFGHTYPMFTLPIGEQATVEVTPESMVLEYES